MTAHEPSLARVNGRGSAGSDGHAVQCPERTFSKTPAARGADSRVAAAGRKPATNPSDGPAQSFFDVLADLVVREACETDPADPDAPDTIKIGVSDLRSAVLVAVERVESRAADAVAVLILTAQATLDSPMFKPYRQVEPLRSMDAALAGVRGAAQ